MASAKEIGRVHSPQYGKYEVDAHVLVRPPLELQPGYDLSEIIAGVVFGNDHSPVSNTETVRLREAAKLGEVAQIMIVRTFDSVSGEPDVTYDRAVSALHDYVTGMAEGNVEQLQPFLPQPE